MKWRGVLFTALLAALCIAESRDCSWHVETKCGWVGCHAKDTSHRGTLQQDCKNAICDNKLNLVYVNFRLCYFDLQIFDTICFLCRCAQGIWWLRGIAPDRRSECPSRRTTVPCQCPSFKTSSAPAPSAAGGRA